MKTVLLILLPILLQIVSGAGPDYADPTSVGNDFTNANCLLKTSTAFTQSPILIESSNCAIYGSFSLTMPSEDRGLTIDNAFNDPDTTYGAPYADYSSATLEFNGTTYTSSVYLIRTKSEHILFRTGRQADAEIQVLMTDSANNNAVLSFLIKELDSASASANIYTDSVNAQYIPSSAATTWSVDFKSLAERITNHADYEVFLNMFTYEGTQTWGTCAAARWFIYGSEIYVDSPTLAALKTEIAKYSDVDSDGNNARLTTGTGGGGGSVKIYRMCYTGYFKVHLDVNYGLWFGMVSILIFFIFTLTYGDKPIRAYDYVESVWTIHPLISIFTYGNEIHTVKTRASLLLAMVTVHGLFSSVFFRVTSDPTRSSNVIVYAIYSTLIDWPITLFVGNILRRYYLAKYQYYKTKEEAWDQKAQNRLFGFYVAVFIINVVGWSFTVWNMAELHAELDEKPSKLWVAAFFIGLGLELLLVYPLVCLMSKRSNFIRRIAKSVGFMYDNLCHESYMDFLKHD